MRLKRRLATIAASLALICSVTAGNSPTQEPKGLSDRFVAWADGQEVEIRFDLEKIKALGLTLKDLESVKYMRFSGDDWTKTIKDVKVDLKKVAELKIRPLQAPPFTVKLLDGREALITPIPKKISFYCVTGAYFQEDVVGVLDSPLVDNPVKATVMSGLIVFGDVPHSYRSGQDSSEPGRTA
jgi:hypothetical protein